MFYLVLLGVIVSIIISYIAIELTIIIRNRNVKQVNFLWSKGLKEKNDYALDKTGSKANNKTIQKLLANNDKHLWIRVVDLETVADNLSYLKQDKILVTGDDDMSVPGDIDNEIVEKIVNCPRITRWYTQNCSNNEFEKIKHYPIGFDLHTSRSKIWSRFIFTSDISSTLDKIKNFKGIKAERKLKIFCDAHLNQSKKFGNPRGRVKEILSDNKNVYFLSKRVGINKLWTYYNEYQFVISPHGNGLDCHRTWEIIYMGAIPIVKTSSLDPLYEALPVVIVQDWDECKDENNLIKWKQEHFHKTNKEYLEPFFKYDYWLQRV